MPKFRVLLTDYAWPDLDIERSILSEADAELIVAEATEPAALEDLAQSADAIMTNWAKVPESVIAASPNCKIISRLGIGLDNIDVSAATARDIPVTNVPDYCLTEVAEHTLALVLGLGRNIGFYHYESKKGRYQLQAGPQLRRLEGQTIGLVGLGNIGSKVAEKAKALGFQVIFNTRTRRDGETIAQWCTLDELLERSDYVSLHLPVTPESRRLLGRAQLAKMKPTAYLINTARGGLVDHAALAEALSAGRLAGAALDVQDPEPPDLSQPPYSDPRVIVTPHAAFVSTESLENLRSRTARQVADRLLGKRPENVVNPEVLERIGL